MIKKKKKFLGFVLDLVGFILMGNVFFINIKLGDL